MALVDWDNTLRPGFTILDWSRHLAAENLFDASTLRELIEVVDDYLVGAVAYQDLAARAPELYAAGLRGSRSAR
ncbi:hypothetical protein GCM10027436_21290 [Actinophytocola sediminis]